MIEVIFCFVSFGYDQSNFILKKIQKKNDNSQMAIIIWIWIQITSVLVKRISSFFSGVCLCVCVRKKHKHLPLKKVEFFFILILAPKIKIKSSVQNLLYRCVYANNNNVKKTNQTNKWQDYKCRAIGWYGKVWYRPTHTYKIQVKHTQWVLFCYYYREKYIHPDDAGILTVPYNVFRFFSLSLSLSLSFSLTSISSHNGRCVFFFNRSLWPQLCVR